MVVDTSALMAIIFKEPDRALYARALAGAPNVYISAGTRIEAALVALGRGESFDLDLSDLLATIGAIVVPMDPPQIEIALNGLKRYGKGRHRARLNLGDSFAYALAMDRDEPLLFKGDDFSHTDVKPAL